MTQPIPKSLLDELTRLATTAGYRPPQDILGISRGKPQPSWNRPWWVESVG